MAQRVTDPTARTQAAQLPGEPVDPTNTPMTIDQAADAGFPAQTSVPAAAPVLATGGRIPQDGESYTPGVAARLDAYRARDRKTTQLARTLGRVFTNTELAVLFDALPDGQGEPVQVLADALGKAWGDTRPGVTTQAGE